MTRADKQRNQDAVSAVLVKNPFATEKELSKAVNLGMGTVHRAKKNLEKAGESKDKRIVHLTDDDFKIVRLAQLKTMQRLMDEEESKNISARDLTYIGDVSAKRYAIFRGELTDAKGGLKFEWDIEPLKE